MPDMTDVYTFFFADEVVLLSDTVITLQNRLDVFKSKDDGLRLTVHVEKSQIVIFRFWRAFGGT